MSAVFKVLITRKGVGSDELMNQPEVMKVLRCECNYSFKTNLLVKAKEFRFKLKQESVNIPT